MVLLIFYIHIIFGTILSTGLCAIARPKHVRHLPDKAPVLKQADFNTAGHALGSTTDPNSSAWTAKG